jgi:hypothetical protein
MKKPKKLILDRKQCRHSKAYMDYEYSYIPGECVMQPERSYWYCPQCDEVMYERHKS